MIRQEEEEGQLTAAVAFAEGMKDIELGEKVRCLFSELLRLKPVQEFVLFQVREASSPASRCFPESRTCSRLSTSGRSESRLPNRRHPGTDVGGPP